MGSFHFSGNGAGLAAGIIPAASVESEALAAETAAGAAEAAALAGLTHMEEVQFRHSILSAEGRGKRFSRR